mmetsp:Transcript_33578/g.40584  ORF Transcript_33578/g.40584 Transcript_33578/m.40584 type:complete len:127 (+) Transcript_33578:121-501(+)|eukprot:CAMPEP_0197855560 /NCGR_PEP_ID=MMETSP1438-20131217/26865_1 /TAXON_ID=1461541 /ORGANISM="Pterosperma sp., Strain CCMP1384" /LENGTH=126 /DNA_ID=CAMNT_0043470723 /DNA_START=119 /DNA_END=499 /DNA_ORIENTATION=-
MGCASSQPKVERALLQILEYTPEEMAEIESVGLTELQYNMILDEFEVIDADSSGFIDFPEMKTALMKMWKQLPEFAQGKVFSDEEVEARIRKYDTNQDGKISRAEYLRYVVLAGQESQKKNRLGMC